MCVVVSQLIVLPINSPIMKMKSFSIVDNFTLCQLNLFAESAKTTAHQEFNLDYQFQLSPKPNIKDKKDLQQLLVHSIRAPTKLKILKENFEEHRVSRRDERVHFYSNRQCVHICYLVIHYVSCLNTNQRWFFHEAPQPPRGELHHFTSSPAKTWIWQITKSRNHLPNIHFTGFMWTMWMVLTAMCKTIGLAKLASLSLCTFVIQRQRRFIGIEWLECHNESLLSDPSKHSHIFVCSSAIQQLASTITESRRPCRQLFQLPSV